MNASDGLDTDAKVVAVVDEGFLEAGVTPELLEAPGPLWHFADNSYSSGVVGYAASNDADRYQHSGDVDDAEGLATIDLLAGIKTLGILAYSARCSDAAGIDDSCRGLNVTTFMVSNHRCKT